MLKKLFSHTAIYGLAPQISKLAYFFALPFITGDLTDIDFGVAGIMTAYTTAISVFATLGLHLILVNSFYQSPYQYKWRWRQIYGFLTLWNLVYAFVLGLMIYFVIPPEAEKDRWLILLLNICPFIFFGQTTIIGNTLFRIKQLPMQIAIRAICFGLMNVVLMVLFIKYYKMGYMGWFWATFISGMLSNISYWYPLNVIYQITPIFNYKWKYIKRSLKVSIPTIPHYYSGYLLSNSDRMIMDFLKINASSIGKYNFAYTIASPFVILSYASGAALTPLVNEFYKKKEDIQARNLVFITQLLFFILTFFSSIWTKEIFHYLVKNESLAQTYPLAIIVIMSQNYKPMYFGAFAKFFFLEKTNALWKVTFIAGITNVGLNLLLIPVLGYKIAAVTTFVSYLYMGYAGFFSKTGREIKTVNYYPILWLITTIILAFVAFYIAELTWPIKMIITLLGGAIGLPFLLRYIKKLNGR